MSIDHSIVAIFLGIVLSSLFTGCSQPTAPAPPLTRHDKRWNLPERHLKYRRLVDEAQASAVQTVVDYVPKTTGQIDDLGLDISEILTELPGVIKVAGPKGDAPTQRIVHLIDHPLPTKDEFLFCLRKRADGGVTSNQFESLYEDYLQQLELIQLEQMVVLRCLIKHHGLRQVFVEGVTQTNLPLYRKKVESLRETGPDAAKEVGERRLERLEIGAAGQLLVLGEIQQVFPLDDPDFIGQSAIKRDLVSTIDKDSSVHSRIHQQKTKEELDYQVHTVLDHGDFGLIVADDHDLAENVHRISGGKCEYVRVKTKWWSEISPLDPNVWGR